MPLDEALDDGVCEPLFNCALYEHDGGDCCPVGEMFGCDGETCVTEELFDDGARDPALNCVEMGLDAMTASNFATHVVIRRAATRTR